jgi:hypothetical protein
MVRVRSPQALQIALDQLKISFGNKRYVEQNKLEKPGFCKKPGFSFPSLAANSAAGSVPDGR